MINAVLQAAEQNVLGAFDLVELLLVIAVLVWVLARSRRTAAVRPLAEAPLLVVLSRTPLRLYGSIAAAGVILRGALLPVMPPPLPLLPDEFSLLLQSDTFVAGRLANPAHPLGAFFETMYVNQAPAYASMYVPGRGLPLALGQWLTGDPWAGVWAAMLLLAIATAWMLRAWVAPPLALVGGLLIVVRYGVFSYWINGYFGGALTALGGVLLIGGFERLRQQVTPGASLAVALGVLLLMITRPFEGLLFALPFAVAVLLRLLSPALGWRGRMLILAPSLAAVIAGAALLGAHNAATTGSALTTAYGVNRAAYSSAPAFWTGDAITPQRQVPAWLQNQYRMEGEPYRRAEQPGGLAAIALSKTLTVVLFYIGAALLLPFLAGLTLWRRYPVPAFGALAVLGGFAMTVWDWAHYLSPALGVFVLVIVLGLDRMAGYRWRGRPVGAALSRALPLLVVAMLLLPLAALLGGRNLGYTAARSCCILGAAADPLAGPLDRRPHEQALLAIPGRHVVLVDQAPNDDSWVTWVHNPADIDAARIVWASDLGPERNRQLLAYYPDRQVWTVHLAAGTPPKLVRLTRPGG